MRATGNLNFISFRYGCSRFASSSMLTRPQLEIAQASIQSHDVDKTFLLVGSLAAFLAVALGAFGAHGLRGRLSPEMLAVFETGVRYHMYHALALMATAVLLPRIDGRAVLIAGWSFTAGIVLFLGSLYATVLT